MKWTYAIKNKFLASVSLFALCLLVLFSHFLDRKHTNSVKNYMATLYEDRLVAEGYILEMTNSIYKISEALHSGGSDSAKTTAIDKLASAFHTTYAVYMKTKLTDNEKATATELLQNFKQVEQNMLTDDHPTLIDKTLVSLNKLSTIQLEESKFIMKKAESEYAYIKVSSQFAFSIVIIILIVLQALVFSSKTLLPLYKQNKQNLN